MRAFLEDVWNAHDLSAFPRFVSERVRFHPPRGEPCAYDRYFEMARDLLAAFPDIHFEIERIAQDGDLAAAQLVITGTNAGAFRGRSATGARVRVVGRPWARVEEGRIVEFWQLFDELGMLHQLGHVPDGTLLGITGSVRGSPSPR